MKKTILLIVIAIITAALFPTEVFAYTEIGVTGDWTCEYEILDSGVRATGGTGTVRLKVTNTADSRSTDIINYVSVSYGAGSASEFYEVKSVTIAPTRDMIIDFSIPIDGEDAGLPNTLWVAMSIRGENNVDGIGAKTGVVFGPEPVYDADVLISTSTTTINAGETVGIAYGGSNLGNKPVDIEVYDYMGSLVFSMDDMDILYLGKVDHTPTHTTTYRYTCKIYKPGTDILVKEVISDPLTITVIQPAVTEEPADDPTTEPEPEEETVEAVDDPTSEPEVTAELEITAEPTQEPVEQAAERAVVVETNSDNNDSNTDALWVIIIALLAVIAIALTGIIIYMIKNSKRN